MNPLSEHIRDDRLNLFVGRQPECQWVQHWLQSHPAPTQVVAITGIGGIGKSSLMMQLLQIARAEGADTAWVDARTCYRTPAGFLDALPASFERWKNGRKKRPMVMAIDNYEDLQVLEAWLREVFLSDLPDTGLLVLFASRPDLMGQWLVDPGWKSRVHVWTLKSFTPDEVAEYLSRRQWPTDDIADARRLALGHPLSLAVVAEGRRPGDETAPLMARMRETLSAQLLREVTDGELQPMVDALSVMLEANLDILQRVLQQKISPDKYRSLKTLSFVKQTSHGVALHDIAAKYLFDEFHVRDPSGFEQVRQQALTVLLNEWESAPAFRQGSVAQHLLWLCRDVFRDITEYADLSYNASDLHATEYRPEDYELACQFIEDWGRQSFSVPLSGSLSLFDRLTREYPESIRITRDQTGRPRGLFVSLMLHRTTLKLLEEYHPLFVRRLLKSEIGITPCAIEDANARFNVLTGIDKRQAQFAPDQILGVAARDQLSFQAGILGLLLLTHPPIKQFLRAIGYRSIPFPVTAGADGEEELFMLDLRAQHFGDWIRAILAQQRRATPRRGPTVEDVRHFLARWDDIRALREAKLTAAWQGQWQDVKFRIETLIDELADPLTPRDREVLRLAFLDPTESAWQAAQALHVSRATFYRYQEKAIEHLTEALSHSVS